MEPIINPMHIYFIEALGSIRFIARLAIVVLAAVLIILFISWMCNVGYGFSDNKAKSTMQMLKKVAVATLITSFIWMVFPSTKTAYTMLAMNYITQDNVDLAGDSAKEVVDYVFEKVKEITTNDEEQ